MRFRKFVGGVQIDDWRGAGYYRMLKDSNILRASLKEVHKLYIGKITVFMVY